MKVLRFVLAPDEDEPIRFVIGQRFQQHRIHNAEDGGVCADAERQRKHRGGREAGALQ